VARRPPEREEVYLDRGRRTTQLMRDSLGSATTLSMRELLRTSSISFAESLRLALENDDIPVFVNNQNAGGLPPSVITIVLANDTDYERGVTILRMLEQGTPKPRAPANRLLRIVIILIVGAFLVLCSNYLWP